MTLTPRQQKALKILAKRKRLEDYRNDPLLWLEERFGEDRRGFEWSAYGGAYETHKWDGGVKDPLKEAWENIAKGNHTGVEAATGTGKTYWLSRLVLWFLDCYPDSLVITSAPKRDQLKLNLWSEIGKSFKKFKKIRPNAEMYSLRLFPEGKSPQDNTEGNLADVEDIGESWAAHGFIAGAGSDEESASRAQGLHRKSMLIIMEEMVGMSPAVINAFYNTCTAEHNILVGVGNPDSELDTLHQFCTQGDVTGYRISGYDYPNVVLDEEVIAGAVTRKSIKNRELKYGKNSGLYLSRVRGISPAQSSTSLIMRKWVEDALNEPKDYDGTYHAIGVDVANSTTGDKAAVVYGRGNVLTEVYEFQCPNASHLAYNICKDSAELMEKGYGDYGLPTLQEYECLAQCIGVDAVGVGVATVNTFLDEGYEVVALQGGQLKDVIPVDDNDNPMYSFGSLRSQMYWELREDLRNGLIYIDIDNVAMMQRLMVELTTPRFVVSSSTVAVERKEDIKKRLGGKSPNVADAVAYWNWIRKGHYVLGGMASISAGD